MTTPSPKHTVLLVDDERNLVRVLETRLRREGYSTLAAFDGAEALTVVRRYPVSVVVLDVRMSGLGGQETLKALQAIRPEMPVVLMSAYGKPEGLPDSVTYLEKPFNLDMLVSAVANALEVRRTPPAEPSTFALFSPGQGVRLVVPDGDALCYGAGWVQNETEDTVEVDAPTREGHFVLPPLGAAVRVTVTGQDALYSFNTRVQRSGPRTLVLTKPDIIERHQRRHAPRLSVALPVHLEVLPPSGRKPVRVSSSWESVNVSDTGMMIAGEARVPANSSVVFSLNLPERETAVRGSARVVWDLTAPERGTTMGLEFTDIEDSERLALRSYLLGSRVTAAPVE